MVEDDYDAPAILGMYIEVDGEPVLAKSTLTWGAWMEKANRRVAATHIPELDCEVSTVFLGMDHNFARHEYPDATPILYETMVFGGEYDGNQRRYATRAEALKGHEEVVDEIQDSAVATVIELFSRADDDEGPVH